jgi:hypothetical protein
VSTTATSSANTLGQFESGLMATIFGVVPSVVIGGFGAIAVALLWIKLFPELWRLQSAAPDDEEERSRAPAASSAASTT